MPPLVMKFGGTSVADTDAIRRIISIAGTALQRSETPPVIVVSAMSGVTDRLLALAAQAESGNADSACVGAIELWRRHEVVARELAPSRAEPLLNDLEREIKQLDSVLRALEIFREASPRSLDGIAAMGELLISRIIAAAFEEAGVAAAWVDPRRVIVTDDQYGTASPLLDETTKAVRREIAPHLAAKRLPVTGGYVGATTGGVTTTLGRGGSDYSAALIGAALEAEIQIWTDVDGMLTADPRVVASPAVVPHLSFAEASELAYFGAKVLHPSTILPAVTRNLPVRILNSRRPDAPGTLITSERPDDGRPLTAIACKKPVTVVDITSTRMLMAYGFLRRVFEVFERYRTAVDVVTTSEVSVSVTVDDDRRLGSIAAALREFADVKIDSDMAILCVVGDNLRRDSTIAARVIGAMDGFALRLVSQAASRRNLTLVLGRDDLSAAMNRLHEDFVAAFRRTTSSGASR
ncbi:MAG TPA: lysine-sensitive aspartokinase 3 [Vicinamibacterales bacterium]|nr:lysine-sensitive aspartokinase 3 [Vicinamibacterales bacterium]